MRRIDVDNLHVTHRMVYDIKPDFDGQELNFRKLKKPLSPVVLWFSWQYLQSTKQQDNQTTRQPNNKTTILICHYIKQIPA